MKFTEEKLEKAFNEFAVIEFTPNENEIIKDSFYQNTDKTWAHFAHQFYRVNESEITDLSSFIQNKIKEDHFESVFFKLESFLKERKNG